ncbi:Dps family protein [uncultured Tateyamaria sp.]|uniref:Dps family protein n=1 Tax=uncultured Tateyamaria sp. TaxID=455651 RepID=UPI00261585D2|nr:DNA starvation/stationary phase protection protein [uncultured Tateyamaria sp.]
MSNALNVVPTEDKVSTGVRDTSAIAEGIADVLADTYRLVFKSHAYHWNVEGPLFYSVHNLTEEHYEDMFKAADDLAERIRALGQLAPSSMADIVGRSTIEDRTDELTTEVMISDLARDHERLAHRFHALIELVEGRKDPVTEDMATARSAFHEKAAWMLRALVKAS